MGKITTFVSGDQIGRILLLNWRATEIAKGLQLDLKVPTALVGDTGCGKTTVVKTFHKRLATALKKKKIPLNIYKLILSMVPPEDIGGLPQYDKVSERVLHRMLMTLPFDSEEWSVIFMDEFDRGTPETQNAGLQALLGGEYHGHFISPNAYPICALNGTADIYTNPMSQAARTRMCTIFMSSNSEGDSRSYDNWARMNGIPQVCRTFSEQFGSEYHSVKDYEELAVCTRRTVDMCGMVTIAKQAVDTSDTPFETDDIYQPILAGIIGMKAASIYMSIEKSIKEGLDPHDILDNADEAEILTDPSMIYYLMQACMGIVKDRYGSDMKKVKSLASYGMRHRSDEWKEIWMTQLGKMFPEFIKTKEYSRWVNVKKRKNIGIM